MLMMTDAFLPEGVTEMAVDSIFMMPHLGVLSTRYPAVATEVFEKDCMIRLGTTVAPWGDGKAGQPAFTARIKFSGGREEAHTLNYGDLLLLPLGVGEEAEAHLEPSKHLDFGEGKGHAATRTLKGGVVGVLLDARGRRPFRLPADRARRVEALRRWNRAVDMYADPASATAAD
jgi:hypothetical protein